MDKAQDRLYVDIKDREIIDKIKKDGILNFKEATNKEIFMLAMSIGHYYGLHDNMLDKKDGLFLSKDLNLTDEAIISSIAIDHFGDIEVINDINQMYDYAQKCAHGGFKILLDTIDGMSYMDKDKKFIVDLLEVYDNIMQKEPS